MTYDPMTKRSRRHRKRQKLGPAAQCILCGLASPEGLMPVSRSWLELHHPLGFAHEPDLTVVVCRTCHAVLSAGQVDDGVPLRPQKTVLETIIAVLTAVGSFFHH